MAKKKTSIMTMIDLSNLLGRKARAAKFSHEQTKQSLKKASLKRWGKK